MMISDFLTAQNHQCRNFLCLQEGQRKGDRKMISVAGWSKAFERNLIPDICLALLEKMLQWTSLSKERVPKVLVLSLPETAFFKNACHPS